MPTMSPVATPMVIQSPSMCPLHDPADKCGREGFEAGGVQRGRETGRLCRTVRHSRTYGIRGSSLKTMSMGPQRTPDRTGPGGAREGAESSSPAVGRTAMPISCAGRQMASGRRTGNGPLADCQISSRTNAARSISPPISTSCTPKYTTLVSRWVGHFARDPLGCASKPVEAGHPLWPAPVGSDRQPGGNARSQADLMCYSFV